MGEDVTQSGMKSHKISLFFFYNPGLFRLKLGQQLFLWSFKLPKTSDEDVNAVRGTHFNTKTHDCGHTCTEDEKSQDVCLWCISFDLSQVPQL